MENPFDPAQSVAIAERQIRQQANQALIRGAGYAATLGFFSVFMVGGLVLLGREGLVLPTVFAGIGGGSALGIRWLAKQQLMHGPTMMVVFSVFVSLPTAFFITAHFVMPAGAGTFINGPMHLIYFPLIVVTGFMFDWRLCLLVGLVTAGGYQLSAVLSLPTLETISIPDAIAQEDLQDPGIYTIKSFILLFTGMVVAGLSVIARGLILAGVKKAYERGNYALVERIGRGGMGEVWTAEHQMLARPAAVKLIRADTLGSRGDEAAERSLARFEEEAQATALLRSPHTIEIYDFGRADDGTFYYVMELLDGIDLESLVDQHGPLPAERVVYLLMQACQSLAEAHEAGLVHRDIKPANLFACRYGLEVDFVKVLDFGLVKDSGSENIGLTTDAQFVGTPAYLAPEMALAKEGLDGRADLYALGCVAYWLLTGTLLFKGETAVAVAAKHLNETPEPPSARTELPIPAELEAVVLACLEKKPEGRPRSAAVLREELAGLRFEEEWTQTRRERWWNRNRPHQPKEVRANPSHDSGRSLEQMLDSR